MNELNKAFVTKEGLSGWCSDKVDGVFPVFLPVPCCAAATTFLEFWKRKQAEIQYDWDMSDFDMEEVSSTLAPMPPQSCVHGRGQFTTRPHAPQFCGRGQFTTRPHAPQSCVHGRGQFTTRPHAPQSCGRGQFNTRPHAPQSCVHGSHSPPCPPVLWKRLVHHSPPCPPVLCPWKRSVQHSPPCPPVLCPWKRSVQHSPHAPQSCVHGRGQFNTRLHAPSPVKEVSSTCLHAPQPCGRG